MPFCMNCGKEIPEGAKFCASCGTAIGTIKKEEPQRKTTYDGEIHKCPNCGEILKSFMPNCPSCGYEIRTVNSSNSPVNELARRIENATSLEMKIELITNFYVPNTKEDIYEFFILAVSNLEDTYKRRIKTKVEKEEIQWVYLVRKVRCQTQKQMLNLQRSKTMSRLVVIAII